MAKKKTVKRRKKVAPKSVGLAPSDTAASDDPEIARLTGQVQSDGGTVLTAYREPIGGTTVLLAALPIDRVEPTPFQRDPSQPHVKRLMNVIETLGRFLDPIIAIREHDGYWTPNGNHRLQALAQDRGADRDRAPPSGSGSGLQDSGAQYGEGAQPEGESRWRRSEWNARSPSDPAVGSSGSSRSSSISRLS